MKPAPPPTPEQRLAAKERRALFSEGLDRYLSGIEIDQNRHAAKHGPMDEDLAHHDLSKILTTQVQRGELRVEEVCGMLAEAVLRGIARKRKGLG